MVHLNHTQLVLFCHVIQCLLKKNITVSWCHIGTTVKFQIIYVRERVPGWTVDTGVGGYLNLWRLPFVPTRDNQRDAYCLTVYSLKWFAHVNCILLSKLWRCNDIPTFGFHGTCSSIERRGSGWEGGDICATEPSWVNYLWQGKIEQGAGSRPLMPQVQCRSVHIDVSVFLLHYWRLWHLHIRAVCVSAR